MRRPYCRWCWRLQSYRCRGQWIPISTRYPHEISECSLRSLFQRAALGAQAPSHVGHSLASHLAERGSCPPASQRGLAVDYDIQVPSDLSTLPLQVLEGYMDSSGDMSALEFSPCPDIYQLHPLSGLQPPLDFFRCDVLIRLLPKQLLQHFMTPSWLSHRTRRLPDSLRSPCNLRV